MILNININYNNYYKKVIENFSWFKDPCPKCKVSGHLIRYGKYNRYLCVMENNKFKQTQLDIQRVYCKYCDHTHAILPIEAIPYCYYSQICILEILKNYYLTDNSFEEITKKYDITQLLIYLFIAKFKKFSNYIADFLRIFFGIDVDSNTEPRILLKLILSKSNVNSLIKEFFDHSKKIFLMVRKENILSRKIFIGLYD